jgi:hypothetical protein
VTVDYPRFWIIQDKLCPALMVPVAIFDPGAVCMQLRKKVISKLAAVSVTVKAPGPSVTG